MRSRRWCAIRRCPRSSSERKMPIAKPVSGNEMPITCSAFYVRQSQVDRSDVGEDRAACVVRGDDESGRHLPHRQRWTKPENRCPVPRRVMTMQIRARSTTVRILPRRLGVSERIFARLAAEGPKPDRIMIDTSHLKAHRTAASLLKKVLCRCIGRTKDGLNS